MKKIYLHWVLIDSIVETVLFYILLVIFSNNNLINNPFSIYSFVMFVLFGVISYIIYEISKRHIRRLL